MDSGCVEAASKENGRLYRTAETNTFAKPDWFDVVAKEYEACRETVGLCDYSSFTKIDLTVSLTTTISSIICFEVHPHLAVNSN